MIEIIGNMWATERDAPEPLTEDYILGLCEGIQMFVGKGK